MHSTTSAWLTLCIAQLVLWTLVEHWLMCREVYGCWFGMLSTPAELQLCSRSTVFCVPSPSALQSIVCVCGCRRLQEWCAGLVLIGVAVCGGMRAQKVSCFAALCGSGLWQKLPVGVRVVLETKQVVCASTCRLVTHDVVEWCTTAKCLELGLVLCSAV